MQFDGELARVLPPDVPNRDRLIEKAARHLALIASANEYMNLTRIIDPREAAIKHVYDCVATWGHFSEARSILDAGTGAGFPGIPLSIALPHVKFTLSESVQKKARFVDSVVESLELTNVHVISDRAEEWAARNRPELITARAVAPVNRMLDLFRDALRRGAGLILYRGPDVEADLVEAHQQDMTATVLCHYELPGGLGKRTLVQIYGSSPSAKRLVRQEKPSRDERNPANRRDRAKHPHA